MLSFKTELEIETSAREDIGPTPLRLRLPPLAIFDTPETRIAPDEFFLTEQFDNQELPENFGSLPPNDSPSDKTPPPPGMVRLVMFEVAQGNYDKKLVYKYLTHLTPGTAEFNAAYIETRLKNWDKARWSASKATPMVKAAKNKSGRTPAAFIRWEVDSFRELLSLGGIWFCLLTGAQFVVAFYSAPLIRVIPATEFIQGYVISDYIGSPAPWPFLGVFATLLVVFTLADWVVYRKMLGRPIFKWAMPALWLGLFSIAPGFICYMVKVFMSL
jgi:hypothetical protein